MKVILASFPKCGTKTMACAFEQLGMRNCDFPDQFMEQHDDWMKLANEGAENVDFKRMFENYDSVTDVPACFFWKQISEAFPDAKIILTKRSSDKIWLESFRNQIRVLDDVYSPIRMLSPYNRKQHAYFVKIYTCMMGHWPEPTYTLNETLAMEAYNRHNAHVMMNAPKDRLLVFDFKDGWEPLCKFLGYPVPDVPFPHKNKSGSAIAEIIQTNPLYVRIEREVKIAKFLLAASSVLAISLVVRNRHVLYDYGTKIANFNIFRW